MLFCPKLDLFYCNFTLGLKIDLHEGEGVIMIMAKIYFLSSIKDIKT
jgi:hypothetical protein